MSQDRTEFVELAARVFMADAWVSMIEASNSGDSDEAEIAGKFPDAPNMSGQNYYDFAPLERGEIDPAAYAVAIKLAGGLQSANVSGNERGDPDCPTDPYHVPSVGELFKRCEALAASVEASIEFEAWVYGVAMQSMGAGVAWDDAFIVDCDKCKAACKIPDIEFGWYEFERDYDSSAAPIE